jgi:fucose 4-O-acetylase-like acetyltransferase
MRNPTFDIMKGIGIVAMIVGHCILPYSLSHYIYAWHMPLFFFVSGYFYKQKQYDYLIVGAGWFGATA